MHIELYYFSQHKQLVCARKICVSSSMFQNAKSPEILMRNN